MPNQILSGKINQDRYPNFRKSGKFYLVRCFACGGEHGKENYAPAVSDGQCAWCGWKEDRAKLKQKLDEITWKD